MDFFKRNLFNLLAAIPIALLSTGTLVINIYLAKYGVIDLSVIDGRAAFVGFVCLIQLIGFVVFWLTLTSFSGSFGELKIICANLAFKPIAYSVLIYLFVGGIGGLTKIDRWGFEWHTGKIFISAVTVVVGYIMLFGINPFLHDKHPKSAIFRGLFRRVCLAAIVYGSCCAILLAILVNEFWLVLKTYLTVSFWLFFWTASIWASRSDMSAGAVIEGASLFSNDGKLSVLDGVFYLLVMMGALLSYVAIYARDIYPHESTNVGGGLYAYSRLVMVDGEIVSGKIVHSNGEYVYISSEDRLIQLPISNVREYRYSAESE